MSTLYHTIPHSDFDTMIELAYLFNRSHPECQIIINCEIPTADQNPNYISLFDSSGNIEKGIIIYADLFSPGTMFSSSSIDDAIRLIINRHNMTEPHFLNIVFYTRPDDLVHYLAF